MLEGGLLCILLGGMVKGTSATWYNYNATEDANFMRQFEWCWYFSSNVETSEINVGAESMSIARFASLILLPTIHDACFLVLRYAGFEEVGFVGERDAFHPIKRVDGVVDFPAI